MLKILPLSILLIIFFASFHASEKNDCPLPYATSSNSEQLLLGNWVLVKIEAPDSIDIVPRATAMEGLRISSEQTSTISYQRVALKDYLEKQLKIYVTKFIFNSNNTFDFF